MAFHIHTTDDGRVPGLEYLPCGALTPKAGMAMKQENGLLTAAAGADAPTYLCMAQRETACAEGDLIPVVRLQADMVLEAATPESFAALPGGKVQLSADGLGLDTAAGGAAEVVYTDKDVTRVRV